MEKGILLFGKSLTEPSIFPSSTSLNTSELCAAECEKYHGTHIW